MASQHTTYIMYSIQTTIKPWSDEEILKAAPAVFAKSPAPNVSDRYGFVATDRIVNQMRELDMHVTCAMGARSGRSREFGQHMVRMRHRDAQLKVGGFVTELVLFNSHDGTSSCVAETGLHRVACTNGLLVAQQRTDSRRIHTVMAQRDIIQMFAEMLRAGNRAEHSVDAWTKIDLTRSQQIEFADRARLTVWSEPSVEPSALLCWRRREDTRADLWTTFNVVQENIMRGGVIASSQRARRTRPIASVKRVGDINRKLWSLAENFAASCA